MITINEKNPKKTICFATMCKNEEHCIKETLESIYKYIDTWVVHDTGSTDNTCKIVTDFFQEKGISGELFIDEWKGFDHNKTQLFNKCYNKSDYILHLDADDLIVGDFKFDIKGDKDAYFLNTKRGSACYKCLVIFNNRVHWKFCGVAHTTIKCIEKNYTTSEELIKENLYLHSRDTGSRSNDPEKYYKDALKLKKQFFDTLYNDPDGLNNRSVFYTAQSYMDAKKFSEALQWYSLYIKLKDTWIEEQYESYIRIGKILIELKKPFIEIKKYIDKANSIFPDRAEGYYILGVHCNYNNKHELAYKLLKTAKEKKYEEARQKYKLFVLKNCYGKYINDELSVSCYWVQKYAEGKKLLEVIIKDREFAHCKNRHNKNMMFFNKKLVC